MAVALQGPPQLPGVWHPAHEQSKELLMWWLDNGATEHARLLPSGLFVAMDCDTAHDFPPAVNGQRDFARVKVHALAPYTGDAPLVYEWWVGLDDLGRTFAGEAHLVPAPTVWGTVEEVDGDFLAALEDRLTQLIEAPEW
jgi:hypothetical protein